MNKPTCRFTTLDLRWLDYPYTQVKLLNALNTIGADEILEVWMEEGEMFRRLTEEVNQRCYKIMSVEKLKNPDRAQDCRIWIQKIL